jgi:hypothetical protein
MTDQMEEMKALQDLGARLAAPQAGPPHDVRMRVLARTRTRSRGRLLHLPTNVWRPVAAAAGAAVVVVSVGLWAAPHGDRAGPASAAPVAPSRNEAVVVLHNAALAALRTTDPVPRPDQFVYTETVERNGTDAPTLRQVWISVDGAHDGFLRERKGSGAWETDTFFGCRDGKRKGFLQGDPSKPNTESCTAEPWYEANLPTDSAAMLRYLYAQSAPSPGKERESNKDVRAWRFAEGSIMERYLPGVVRSALFEAMSHIPGTVVQHGVVDATGRPGIGVSLVSRDVDPKYVSGNSQLIFDARTYALLGDNWILKNGPSTKNAFVRSGLVDKVGQLP